MRTQPTLLDAVTPVVNLVPDDKLKNAILQSFTDAPEAVKQIEACFRTLPIQRWSDVTMSTFFHSWKATHLKMLAIYGLSCRLQRQALQSEGAYRLKLLEASALNAETSHEDLGLDFDGKTHAELYDQLVMTYLGHDHWQLAEYGLPAALTFKSWIYRNMVVEDDLHVGIFTNMFSEIYNHAEYSVALEAFSGYADQFYAFTPEQKEVALGYIQAHIEDDTEMAHFMVMIDALQSYNEAAGRMIDYDQAQRLFTSYLEKLGNAFAELTLMMQREMETQAA